MFGPTNMTAGSAASGESSLWIILLCVRLDDFVHWFLYGGLVHVFYAALVTPRASSSRSLHVRRVVFVATRTCV